MPTLVFKYLKSLELFASPRMEGFVLFNIHAKIMLYVLDKHKKISGGNHAQQPLLTCVKNILKKLQAHNVLLCISFVFHLGAG